MKKKMNKKKATLLLLMTGILAASLTACQSKKDDSGKTKIEEGSKAMGGSTDDYLSGSLESEASYYRQVLDNSIPFISTDADEGYEKMYLSDFTNNEYEPSTPRAFAYLDLDEDGQNEVVLEMDYGLDGAYAVLKEIDGTIYGYDFNYRSINPLYADGTIMGSNGAANNELYRLEFTTDGALENLDAGIDTTASTKTPATWYDFTDENIDKIIGGASQETSQTSSQGTSQTGSQGTSQNASLGSLMTINQKNDGYVFNHTNEEYLSEDELAYIPTEILRIARNEIYARHGYQFTSDMKTFFENKTWYNGTVPASQWSDSKLNTYEKKNVQLIQKYENLGAKVPFTTSSAAGGTQINGDGFTLTLPSEWNSSNYFATKGSSDDCDYYTFYSKNNYAYGYGGILFSIFVYDGPAPADARYGYDGFGELGNDGSHYYYMGGPTDIQWAPDISALESEYMSLYNTFDEIKSSFKKM